MEEYKVPEFVKRYFEDKQKNEDRQPSKFVMLLEAYRKKFGDSAPTEPSSWSEEEWCEILEECLEKNITVEETFGIDYDEDVDY